MLKLYNLMHIVNTEFRAKKLTKGCEIFFTQPSIVSLKICENIY